MRRIVFAIVIGLLGAAPLAAQELYVEQETARWGADYSRFEVSSARGCGEECARDPNCLAWTWARPGAEGPAGVCHLKAEVPFAGFNPCCDSGVVVGTGFDARPPSVRAMLRGERQTAEIYQTP